MISITLPWPPSINHYWRHTKNGHYISKEGKTYRETVYYSCVKYKGKISDDSRLSVIIEAFPPDKRKRDLDNILKSLLDALQHAGMYKDDNQIDRLSIHRKIPLNGVVRIEIDNII